MAQTLREHKDKGFDENPIWATQIFWAARETWANAILIEVCVYVCVRYFPFYTDASVVKPAKFTRDSGCLTRDGFLVILIEDLIFAIVLLLGTALHTLGGVFPVLS